MQQPLDQHTLSRFPEQLRGMVSRLYDADSICFNDVVILANAFASEPIPRYNTKATAIAAVLGHMNVFNWAIAAGYNYSSYEYKQAANARSIDLQAMIDQYHYSTESPPAQYPARHITCNHSEYTGTSQRDRAQHTHKNLPVRQTPAKKVHNGIKNATIPPYYDVYNHSKEFYGIEEDSVLFGDMSDDPTTDDGPTGDQQMRDDIVELAQMYKRSNKKVMFATEC